MKLSELLQELEISEDQLLDWLDALLKDYPAGKRALIVNYLKRNPKFLVMLLQGDLSLEDVFRLLLELCPGTEIEFEPPAALVQRWAREGCLAELVVFGGMSVLAALMLMERPQAENKGGLATGINRKIGPKNI